MPLYKISFCNDRWAKGLATLDKENLMEMVRNGSIDRRAKNMTYRYRQNKKSILLPKMSRLLVRLQLFQNTILNILIF